MKSALKKVSLILAICFVAFHLYTAAFGTMPGIAQKSIHLGFLLVIFYINAMVDSEKRWEQIFLGIMALFALAVPTSPSWMKTCNCAPELCTPATFCLPFF